MSAFDFWLAIGLLGLGTWIFRVGFHAASNGFTPSRRMTRALDTLPAAILAGVAAPSVILPGEGGFSVDPATAVAAGAALLAGAWTRRFMWSLLAGLIAGAAALLILGV